MVTAKYVLNQAAALMNDKAETIYTNDAVLPYFKMAIDTLEKIFRLNNVPITNTSKIAIRLSAGTTVLSPFPTAPFYPADLIEVQNLWERLYGSNEGFTEVVKQEFEPAWLHGIQSSSLQYYWWDKDVINFLPANTDRELKLDYIRSLFPNSVTADSIIYIDGVGDYLYYKSASLMSDFVGENPTRAVKLASYAEDALEQELGISSKSRQNIVVRRRPFRAAYKSRRQ